MKVFLNNRLIDISPSSIIGSGGEGIVAKISNSTALKVYHVPTKARSKKLLAFLSQNWLLSTGNIALPQAPVYNTDRSLVVGFTMPFFGNGVEDLAAFSNKRSRQSLALTTKQAIQVFLHAGTVLESIHKAGLVVGDLSDLNVQFRGNETFWIDVDAWQFGSFPCPVATVEFVDPGLYNTDFSAFPAFKAANDWYSFAVLLFRSLLLVHPYGGSHNRYKSLQERAKNKITVFDSGVTYPKLAYPPEILSRKLVEEFERIFKKGIRGVFSSEVLNDYLHLLTQCSSCGAYYTSERNFCPVCSKETIFQTHTPVIENRQIKAVLLLQGLGNIVYAKVQEGKVYAICEERGKSTLNIVGLAGGKQSLSLPFSAAHCRFVLAGNLLAVNKVGSEDLAIYSIESGKIKKLETTVTDFFSLSKRAAFSGDSKRIYRVVGGVVMALERRGGKWLERQVYSGIKGQTWFSANGDSSETQVFGFSQVIKDQHFWYCLRSYTFEPKLTKLQVSETMLDISVKFSGGSVLVRRKTQYMGEDFLYTDLVDETGQVVFHKRIKMADSPVSTIHGTVFSGTALLHATDAGVVQEKVKEEVLKTFTQTERFVSEGESLHKLGNGLVVVGSNTATYLELR